MQGIILHQLASDATADSLIDLSEFDCVRQHCIRQEQEAEIWGLAFFQRAAVDEIDVVFQHYESFLTASREEETEEAKKQAAGLGLNALQELMQALAELENPYNSINPYVLVLFLPFGDKNKAKAAFDKIVAMQKRSDRDGKFTELKSY